MAGSMNMVVLIGRLTRDPELRYTPSGTAVCNMGMAVDRAYKSTGGPDADFFDVIVWNQGNRKLAELCGQYLQKGRLVCVRGQLQNRSWEDQQTGQKRYKTEVRADDVHFLDSQRDQSAAVGERAPAATAGSAARPPVDSAIDPDDIPF